MRRPCVAPVMQWVAPRLAARLDLYLGLSAPFGGDAGDGLAQEGVDEGLDLIGDATEARVGVAVRQPRRQLWTALGLSLIHI